MERIPKPPELLAARSASVTLFTLLRRWFDVPPEVVLDLRGIDAADRQLVDVQQVMALAMRKLQALHLLTAPQVATTTDVVLTLVQDLERPLRQAPRARLRRQAASTDWDAELRALDGGGSLAEEAEDAEDAVQGLLDEESRTFREAHQAIRAAAQAVLRASDGQIRRLG
jgi:hypothetical protein